MSESSNGWPFPFPFPFSLDKINSRDQEGTEFDISVLSHLLLRWIVVIVFVQGGGLYEHVFSYAFRAKGGRNKNREDFYKYCGGPWMKTTPLPFSPYYPFSCPGDGDG